VTNDNLQKRALRALIILVLGGLGVGVAGCDDSDVVQTSDLTAPSRFHAEATGPTIVSVNQLSVLDCSGFVFTTPFDLAVTASTADLTMNSATFRLIDGTTLGGPSVTIPTPQLNARFGSTFVRAGTTRVFGLEPVFTCTPHRPQFITATAVVTDPNGVSQALTVTAQIQ